MVGWNHGNAKWKPKSCPVCGAEFTPKSGVNKFCSEPCKGRWKYISGVVSTESQYKSISGNWDRYTSRLIYCAGRKRDNLTKDIILQKLEEQNYRCAISGLPLTCLLEKGVKHPYNASIDRVVAGGPYSAHNIQIVCRCLNSWRADTPLDDFIAVCKAVAEHNKGSDNA